MSWILLALNVGIVLLLFAVGLAVERDGRVDALRRSLPGWLQTAAGGLALAGPWFLYFQGVLPQEYLGGALDGSVVALALTLVLWVAYPPICARFVETASGPQPARGC